ncbi:hypothetical protein SAMN05421866_1692 [Chryseobacterium oranimense]|uniref:dTDP-4-amino-4,6-dideoxygalactose transaminase n=1 Tax=Chryseobacterium oranimense TaxID=421058 RepID=A0A1M5P6F4_9FLAO|nr:hypothetical protein [Chryseobacterium oranimense]SHG97342.1 hypothetical protein SAMN05421866_1692 [Chryseobacterium oranimense]
MSTKSIGGYFELELPNTINNWDKDFIELNSARNCLEYILLARKSTKIYLAYYTCDVLLEPIKKLNINYEFYDIDFNLEPIFDYSKIKDSEIFLYTNYFGIKDKFINILCERFLNKIVIDNAQSFFSLPITGVDTFYSPRKFVGVADGGFLSSDKKINSDFERDQSYDRMSHLLKRIDLSAEEAYIDFCANDRSLENQPIKLMSNLTKKILSTLNFDDIKKRRKENFAFLNERLKENNLLKIDISEDSVPMIYPFRTKNKDLKKQLINKKIYCATYWPNVFEWCSEETNSYILAEEIIALPIDQRYSINDMRKILENV